MSGQITRTMMSGGEGGHENIDIERYEQDESRDEMKG